MSEWVIALWKVSYEEMLFHCPFLQNLVGNHTFTQIELRRNIFSILEHTYCILILTFCLTFFLVFFLLTNVLWVQLVNGKCQKYVYFCKSLLLCWLKWNRKRSNSSVNTVTVLLNGLMSMFQISVQYCNQLNCRQVRTHTNIYTNIYMGWDPKPKITHALMNRFYMYLLSSDPSRYSSSFSFQWWLCYRNINHTDSWTWSNLVE